MEKYVDLHVHSCFSDGVHQPAELVKMASSKGLLAIAIADHDSTEGVDEAIEAGQQFGVEVIPAVELSVAYKGLRDVHLLGYFIDHRDREFGLRLSEFRRRRDVRARAIVEKISSKVVFQGGKGIEYDDVRAIAGESVSRLHIAKVLVAKGVVSNVQDAFKKYLVSCDVPKEYYPMEDALKEIRRLGGVAIIAHPPSISQDRKLLRDLIREWVAMGLDGIEVFNNLCFKDDMIFLETVANESGLLMTGGSDYHGFEDDVEMGIGRGGLSVAYRLLKAMKEVAGSRSKILEA